MNNMCGKGRKLYNCPNSDVSICIKSGENYSKICNQDSISKIN